MKRRYERRKGVEELNKAVEDLKELKITVEPIRLDETTNKKFTFFSDPDDLPIELYEK